MKMSNFDFSGWATRANVKCSDGRTILRDAFIKNDGQTVPLVWNHEHNDPNVVLGHALLENRPEGVYTYCSFNNTEQGKNAKELVKHGDIVSLSIYANQLKQDRGNVMHGNIREVSLVLAGANPEAFIDSVIMHGEYVEEDALIYAGDQQLVMHSEEEISHSEAEETNTKNDISKENEEMPNEKTVKDVFDEMTEEQKNVVYAMVALALDQKNEGEKEDNMKHNVFDNYEDDKEVLSHSDMAMILSDAKRAGSLKEAVLEHGITDIEYLFPDNKTVTNTPEFIKRDTSWVSKVMNSVHHTPFSRIKSVFANLTEAEARAKGYIKGHQKVDEVFSLLKRSVNPTTIYKKQKIDRDDMIDITDFDVVSWIKGEMRMMLDEEIARAILVGDGRLGSSDDKINEANIIPIAKDASLYTIQASCDFSNTPKDIIRTLLMARKNYKGSGNPTLFTTEDVLTELLLLEDTTGRMIYESEEKLARVLRVKEIVTVEVMESAVDANGDPIIAIVCNLNDYNVGADKGGAVNMFDDFDIDYNAQKYLIETRCSGALIKPYAAICVVDKA